MFIFVSFLVLIICHSEKSFYLQENEGFIINQEIDYNILNNNDNQILEKIESLYLENCFKPISIKYFNDNNDVNILCLTFQQQYRFTQLRIRFKQRYENKFYIQSIDMYLSIDFKQNNQICFDFYFSYLYDNIIVICSKVNSNEMFLIYHSINSKFVKQIQINSLKVIDECQYNIFEINNKLFLLACFGTEKWSMYNLYIYSLNNENILTNCKVFCEVYEIFSNIDQLDQEIYQHYFLDQFVFYAFNQQQILIINLTVYLYGFQLNGDNLQISKYFIDNQNIEVNQIEQKIIKNIKDAYKYENLTYFYSNQYKLFYNQTHLFINDRYQQQNIDNLLYQIDDLIIIYTNKQIQVFQILLQTEIIHINNEQIIIKYIQNDYNNKDDDIILKNIQYHLTPTQYKKIKIQKDIFNNNTILIDLELNETPIIDYDPNEIKLVDNNTFLSLQSTVLPIIPELLEQKDKELIYFNFHLDITTILIWLIKEDSFLYLYIQYININTHEIQNVKLIKRELIPYQDNLKYWATSSLDNSLTHFQLDLILWNGKYIFDYTLQEVKDFETIPTVQGFSALITNIKIVDYNQLLIFTKDLQLIIYNRKVGSFLKYQLNQKSPQIILQNEQLIVYNDNNLITRNSKDFRITNIISLENIIDYELISLQKQHILIVQYLSDKKIQILHYYITSTGQIIYVKTLPLLDYKIIYPFNFLQTTTNQFVIEAQDDELKQKVVLLYDISLPAFYCLKQKIRLLSNDYILSNQGEIVFIYENKTQVIHKNGLLLQQKQIDFNRKFQKSQKLHLQFEFMQLKFIIQLEIDFYNFVHEIEIFTNPLIINYDSSQNKYKLPISEITQGNINQVSVNNSQFSITLPLEIIQQYKINNVINQLNETIFIQKDKAINESLILKIMKLQKNKNNLYELVEITNFHYLMAQSNKQIIPIQIEQEMYILISSIIRYLQISIYKLVKDEIKLVISLQITLIQYMQYCYPFQRNDNFYYLIRNDYQYFLIKIIKTNSIFSYEIVEMKYNENYKIYHEQNILYFWSYSKDKYQINFFSLNVDILEPEFAFSVYHQYLTQEIQILHLYIDNSNQSNNQVTYIYKVSKQFTELVEYKDMNYKYLSLQNPYHVGNQLSLERINNNILIVRFFQKQKNGNYKFQLYNIENHLSHEIVYPLMKFPFFSFNQKFQVEEKIIAFVNVNEIIFVQLNELYFLNVGKGILSTSSLDLTIQNELESQIIKLRFIEQNKINQVYIIIIIIFVLIQTSWIFYRSNKKKLKKINYFN